MNRLERERRTQIGIANYRSGNTKSPESTGITESEKGKLKNDFIFKILSAVKNGNLDELKTNDGRTFLDSCAKSLGITGSQSLNPEYFITYYTAQTMDNLGRLGNIDSLPPDPKKIVLLIRDLEAIGIGVSEVLKLTCDHFKYSVPPQYKGK